MPEGHRHTTEAELLRCRDEVAASVLLERRALGECAAVVRMKVKTTPLRSRGEAKEAALCGTAKNTVRVHFL
jgi:hypothetical protein